MLFTSELRPVLWKKDTRVVTFHSGSVSQLPRDRSLTVEMQREELIRGVRLADGSIFNLFDVELHWHADDLMDMRLVSVNRTPRVLFGRAAIDATELAQVDEDDELPATKAALIRESLVESARGERHGAHIQVDAATGQWMLVVNTQGATMFATYRFPMRLNIPPIGRRCE
ncbi:Aste57867_21696 [Aphanomyces stellatus]|uniref:Aste57867_21696 protein n=1 Tax=Aphanomyces stellatus TaxID=120398 RepID=A0A485LIV0_9STRA|nr:hypothetical protein As57867_021627 [Aphanomyces stellatus]VFT98365.1 Aste57867_21696 [Aphanomyces stellatus]